MLIEVLRCSCNSLQVYRRLSRKLDESPIKDKKITLDDEEKMRRLLNYEEAPEYLQHNPYILHGYRGYLTTKLCIERFVLNITRYQYDFSIHIKRQKHFR